MVGVAKALLLAACIAELEELRQGRSSDMLHRNVLATFYRYRYCIYPLKDDALIMYCNPTSMCHHFPNQVTIFGDKPALVSLYSRTAARAFEPFGKEIGQVSYETSLAQVWSGTVSHGYSTESNIEILPYLPYRALMQYDCTAFFLFLCQGRSRRKAYTPFGTGSPSFYLAEISVYRKNMDYVCEGVAFLFFFYDSQLDSLQHFLSVGFV